MGVARIASPLRISLLLAALPVGAQTLPDTQVVSLNGFSVKTFATPYGRNPTAWGHSMPAYGVAVNVSVSPTPSAPIADARVTSLTVCGQTVSRYERTTPAVPAQIYTEEELRGVGAWRLGNPWNGAGLPREAQPERVFVDAEVRCNGQWFHLSWMVDAPRRAALRAREEAFFSGALCEAVRE